MIDLKRKNFPNQYLCFRLLQLPIWILFLTLTLLLAAKIAVACDSQTKDYIVFTDQPEGQDLKDYAIQILTSVLGSKEAARKALGYVYRHVGPGFSARLTPEQASRLKHQPGVLYVKESEIYEPNTGQVAWRF